MAQVAARNDVEIIVPYDRWSLQVSDLSTEFEMVDFHLSEAEEAKEFDVEHRHYDQRRAAGLRISRGRLVAMTEDHAVPAADWVEKVLEAHKQDFLVIGGPILDGSNHPLNSAIYYCDFGRYGLPFESGRVSYVSDVNVAYKREALELTRHLWWAAYHETTVHWALQGLGFELFLDNRPIVTEKRPAVSLYNAFVERTEWGRVFAETRANTVTIEKRAAFALGAVLLPALMFSRVLRHMLRQRISMVKFLRVVPYVLVLLVGWGIGEMEGYITSTSNPVRLSITPPSMAPDDGHAEAVTD